MIALTPALQVASVASSTFYSIWNLFAVGVSRLSSQPCDPQAGTRTKNCMHRKAIPTSALACPAYHSNAATWRGRGVQGFIIPWGSQPWYLRWYYYLDPGEPCWVPSRVGCGAQHDLWLLQCCRKLYLVCSALLQIS